MSTLALKVRVQNTSPNATKAKEKVVSLPPVFGVSLRPDLVRTVHTLMAKNKRQAYGVSSNAGYQTSASSWGTGRAVSRIPRVPGGGTHRTGQGAFGNMCRGGGMFNPNKTWRRWHRHINLREKRHAITSAIASTGIASLVLARGHKIMDVPEVPLVVSDKLMALTKTKEALKLLMSLGCGAELKRVENSKSVRCGRGKSRNRRYTLKKGPLIVYHENGQIIERAFRNIPGVDLCHVDRLNLLKLAPGGTLGRFVIWTRGSIVRLFDIYSGHSSGEAGKGSLGSSATRRKAYTLMKSIMPSANLGGIINSEAVQSKLRPLKKPVMTRKIAKINLLKRKSDRYFYSRGKL